jgi:hypothetical protein
VLLLFALVLGLSAVVASLAPPPERERKGSIDEEQPTLTTPSAGAQPAPGQPEKVRFEAPDPADTSFKTPTRLVEGGSSLSIVVAVPVPGDVVLDGLGLRQAADPLAPAHFEVLARPPGKYAVLYQPVTGDPRLVGRLEFSAG